MTAIKRGMTIIIGKDFADSVSGVFENEGYRVILHGLPKFTNLVDAATADEAHAIALKLAQSEGYCQTITGATITRLNPGEMARDATK